jgi:hypothetical protein
MFLLDRYEGVRCNPEGDTTRSHAAVLPVVGALERERGRGEVVLQAVNILVLVIVYAGVVFYQLWFVERRLPPLSAGGAIARAILSSVHAVVGFFFFIGVGFLLNVIVNHDYRKMAFEPYWDLIPLGGVLFGLLLPWLPLLWTRREK